MTKRNLTVSDENRKAFSQRLKEIIGNRSGASFAKACGFSQTAMSQYLTGKSEPTRPVLVAIAKEGNVNLEWLMCGTGSMRKSEMSGYTVAQALMPDQYPPFVPIIVKAKIIGVLLSNETSGRDLPLKEVADSIVDIYLDDYHTYLSGERELPSVEASTEVIESMRPRRKVSVKAG